MLFGNFITNIDWMFFLWQPHFEEGGGEYWWRGKRKSRLLKK